jgi:AraC-like DNA-binding protein
VGKVVDNLVKYHHNLVMGNQLRGQDYFPQTGLPLSVLTAIYYEPYHLHSHDFAELVVVTGGHALHDIGADSYHIGAGDVFVILGSEEHAYYECEGMEFINVLFDMPKLHLPMNDIYQLPAYHALFALEPRVRGSSQGFHHHLTLNPADLKFIAELLLQIKKELREKHSGYKGMAVSMFTQAIIFLSRRYALNDDAEPRRLLQVGRVLSFIEANLADTISLQQLSSVAGTSVSTLQRMFRQTFRKSPVDYIIHRRFEKARELLEHTNLTITEITYQVGFSDSSYFAYQFKQRFSFTPGQFRKLARIAPAPCPPPR